MDTLRKHNVLWMVSDDRWLYRRYGSNQNDVHKPIKNNVSSNMFIRH